MFNKFKEGFGSMFGVIFGLWAACVVTNKLSAYVNPQNENVVEEPEAETED